jgi:hypothetical protein
MGNAQMTGIDVSSLIAEKGDTLEILRDESVWICDTGASTHVTWSSKCVRNIWKTQTYSLGHTKEAVEPTVTVVVNIPGIFQKTVQWE